MMSDNVREVWSEDELDSALAALRSDVDTSEEALARARADLVGAANVAEPAREPTVAGRVRAPWWRHWWAAAAATVALAATPLLVLQLMPFGGARPATQPPPTSVAEELNLAADNIGADQPLGPRQYRYVAETSWSLRGLLRKDGTAALPHLVLLAETRFEHWVPANWRQKWWAYETATGNYRWVVGSNEQAWAAGGELPRKYVNQRHEPCADFYRDDGIDACHDAASWRNPSVTWMAKLPRDPQRLYAELSRGTSSSTLMLEKVASVLFTGQAPADLRAALYRTLAMVPGLKITDSAANLDGRTGTAFGYGDDHLDLRPEIIIDMRTGEFVGERQTLLKSAKGVPAGTVVDTSSLTTAVVDRQGDRPTR